MTYCRLLDDGRYEYGRIEKAKDRRKDRMVPVGTAPTCEDAMRLRGEMEAADKAAAAAKAARPLIPVMLASAASTMIQCLQGMDLEALVPEGATSACIRLPDGEFFAHAPCAHGSPDSPRQIYMSLNERDAGSLEVAHENLRAGLIAALKTGIAVAVGKLTEMQQVYEVMSGLTSQD